ncbi:putative O-glycosylation ligase, exosortase A system-associated [Novosphingobium umbonatum]|uniref:Putative O-glycosylation ligase, exosortase A system-associated n=1 Tax=Novosphingobium umbonatum TaxID=1908524 RepID=A0A437N2T6_9SPHN|nr:putative O-glycosylation ligase, exosortase A system-associated [Novosphingobium umbonatum]RVU04239.1 putative O-glycosylation ligase, exosortase A system-associated [Novosphingobium umbonatum]
MRDIFLSLFMLAFLLAGLRRPFVWVLAYLYVDILAPQKISYGLLSHVPLSLLVFFLAVVGWVFFDNKMGSRASMRQGIMVLLLAYCFLTTQTADFPDPAAAKWAWVWKSLVFAIFLPFTLRTPLRIEAAALVMVMAAGALIIDGGVKTLAGGGGYGELAFFINDNTGLYEASTLACVAIAIIPLILWLGKNGTIFPPDWRTKLFSYALTFSALLIPVGTEARTGLLCAGLLAVLMMRSVRYRWLYLAGLALAGLAVQPLLPSSFSSRMGTIENNKADQSASTRLAVWKWTLSYAGDHPFGGGFDSYRGNKLVVNTKQEEGSGATVQVNSNKIVDAGRAFHSAYFEMLGEQGWPGLALWLILQISGLLQLEAIRRRLRKSEGAQDRRDADLALALQQGHLVYLLGAAFVGIAYQPFIYMLIALQIALVQQVRRRTEMRLNPLARRVVVARPHSMPDVA